MTAIVLQTRLRPPALMFHFSCSPKQSVKLTLSEIAKKTCIDLISLIVLTHFTGGPVALPGEILLFLIDIHEGERSWFLQYCSGSTARRYLPSRRKVPAWE